MARRGPADSNLRVRTRVRQSLRHWFDQQGFVEVDTPALQVSPGWEAHIHPFVTTIDTSHAKAGTTGTSHTRYLRTSPELSMKKLLVAGHQRIYQLCPAYRKGDISPLHQPEFTLLEWYRVGDDSCDAVMADCRALILHCAGTGIDTIIRAGRTCDLAQPWRRISVAKAYQDHAGVDVLASVCDDGTPNRDRLARDAKASGVRVAADDAWDDIFHRIFYTHISPHLGMNQPDFLTDYPAPLAALAELSPRDPRVSRRFELFIHGIEVANGCAELRGAHDYEHRHRQEQERKQQRYGYSVPADENFIRAMDGLPTCSGVALGFDRLVLLLCGADDIRDVIWEPVTG